MFRLLVPLGWIVLAACGNPAAQQATTPIAGGANTTVATDVPLTIAPTNTSQPTYTPLPTYTALPTYTPLPAATTPPTTTPTSASALAGGAAGRPTTQPTSIAAQPEAQAPTTIVAQPEAQAPTTIAAQPEGQAPTTPPAPPPTWTAAPSTNGQRFVTVATPDGFVAVRDDPNTNSPMLRSLVAGTEVVCTGVTEGESLEFNGQRSNRWYLCPQVGGFIFELLVQPAAGAAPPAPSGPPVVHYVDDECRVVLTPDGFVSVRTRPTTASTAAATLTAGTVIRCTQIVKGEQLTYLELTTNQWLYCPSNGGYIFAPLLVTTQGAAAVVEPYIVP